MTKRQKTSQRLYQFFSVMSALFIGSVLVIAACSAKPNTNHSPNAPNTVITI